MQAQVLEISPVVTDRERADEWAGQLEDLLLEVGQIFPRAELRRRAAGCVRGLLGPSSRKNGWQLAEYAGDARPHGQQHLLTGPVGTSTNCATSCAGRWSRAWTTAAGTTAAVPARRVRGCW